MDDQQTLPGTQTDRVTIEGLEEAVREWKTLEAAAERAKKVFNDHKGHVQMLLLQNERRKYVAVVDGKEKEVELDGGPLKVKYRERDVGAPRRAPRRPRIVPAPVRPPAAKKKTTSKPFNPPKLKPAKKTKGKKR